MKKTLTSLILSGIVGCCSVTCDINQDMPSDVEKVLKRADFYEYVIKNINDIRFVDIVNDGKNTGESCWRGSCCTTLIAEHYYDYSQNPPLKEAYKDIARASILVHEAAHCETKSGSERYPNSKEQEFNSTFYK